MKKIIRLTESELVSLVKRTIMEETTNNAEIKIWGCNLFPPNSEEREWCQCATSKVDNKKSIIIEKVSKVIQILKQDDYSDISEKKLKYFNNNDPFFKERSEKFKEVRDILNSYCSKTNGEYGTIAQFRNKIMRDAVFIEKKDDKSEYSLLNKLNSNYTAVAYLLTIHRNRNKLIGKTFDFIFNDFFENSEIRANRGQESKFVDFMLNFLTDKEDEVEIMREVFKTIQATTDIGLQTETDAYRFLVRKYGPENVINYSGDYSFVDLFGIDFMVKGIEGYEDRYIPTQVKTNIEHLYGNAKVCENVVMAKKNGEWVMILFDGKNKLKKI
jgi:hypothetical protein